MVNAFYGNKKFIQAAAIAVEEFVFKSGIKIWGQSIRGMLTVQTINWVASVVSSLSLPLSPSLSRSPSLSPPLSTSLSLSFSHYITLSLSLSNSLFNSLSPLTVSCLKWKYKIACTFNFSFIGL